MTTPDTTTHAQHADGDLDSAVEQSYPELNDTVGEHDSASAAPNPAAEQRRATVHDEHEDGDDASARALFADHDLTDLRARWDSVQAAFVDDPAQCVKKADGLVSDVVEQLTSSFSQARSRLEEQWARGEEASTEDLRIALKRYREFFQRLLAV
jgi:hypothetical protein